jgi:16S rRNA processing protein RimM
LKFFGVDSIAQAEGLRGAQVLIPRTERTPLGPHQYYLWELEGCRVVIERDGPRREIGTVTGVELTGGVDLLHVAAAGREVLIPLAQDICKQIDPETKTILIDPPDDLLELNE